MTDSTTGTRRDWWNDPRKDWPERIIVMRHAHHRSGIVGAKGQAQIADVAGALAEWCILTGTEIAEFDGFTADERLGGEVLMTASFMQQYVGDEIARAKSLPAISAERRTERLEPALQPVYPRDTKSDARTPRLVVLNEPLAGQFVSGLAGAALELRHAELVLLEREGHVARVGGFPFVWLVPYRARWTMAPKVPEGDPLQAKVLSKITSKMHTAGVLGGLITSLLTFVLTRLVTDDIPWNDATFASLVAFGVSATWFFVAMFYYDSLTMPSEFWGRLAPWRRWHRPVRRSKARDETPGWLLARPPSGTTRVLQLNMVRIWSTVFRPAILALGVGVGALLLALDEPTTPTTDMVDLGESTAVGEDSTDTDGESTAAVDDSTGAVDLGEWHAGILVGTALVAAAWSWHFRPRLGASD